MADPETPPRTWLITGGTRGIGAGIARRALDEGDRVAVVSRSADSSDHGKLPPQVEALEGDVTDARSLDSLTDRVSALMGRVDVLVNNAGVHGGGLLERLERSTWDTVLATNLTATMEVTRHLLRLVPLGGTVINVGAVVGLRGFSGDAAYGASKAGLVGLTKVLAVELARRQIRVNLLVPGFVETDMTAGLADGARQRIRERIPLDRPADVSEIADAAWWMAGATYLTGAVVAVDGGLTAALGSR